MDINRADSSGINPAARQKVLQAYHIAGTTPLATGSEAEVYDYRPDSVLKIYADSSRYRHFRTLRQFYDMLNTDAITFSLPKITQITRHDDLIALIERRVKGVPLEDKLSGLTAAQHEQAETLYLDAVFDLRHITLTDTPETYLLFDDTQHSRTDTQRFNPFYAGFLAQKLTRVGRYFAATHPAFTDNARQLVSAIRDGHTETLCVVHGDFFPGNVLVNEALTRVHGVIDFGSFTFFGNYLLDVAGAFGFYRMYDPDRIHIRRRLLPKILDRLTPDDHAPFFQYLLAQAILTSDLYAPAADPTGDGHFQWATELIANRSYWQQALTS